MKHVLIITEKPKDFFEGHKSANFHLTIKNLGTSRKSQDIETTFLRQFHLVLLDLQNERWGELLTSLRYKVPVIAFGDADIALIVESIKMGALDFLSTPITIEKIEKFLDKYCKTAESKMERFDNIVGESPQMLEVYELIKKAAMSDSNVLITGESGTGKEPVARAIHRWSPRKAKPFMTINCSAIPDTLLESELFGFEKGAFTGANYTKKGIFELADGGTVLLDEIGDVSPLFQVKVLRVLQYGEIIRIGGSNTIKVDLRIIAATNKNLKEAIQKKTFREDLYYRLNVINIHLPPLRERMVDIPLLVNHFIKKYAYKRTDLLIKGITSEAMTCLMNYSYPGNVGELENIIERAISLANHPEICPEDLPSFLFHKRQYEKKPSKLKEVLDKTEKEMIWLALQESRGNITKAANALGIHRQQLQRKIKNLKIAVDL
ncbi:MAG: sigma-54 dependent transcriptional regulator [Thermodesulfovibrionales bacterium]|nr:sigma-54 dependent transcriptional regulator [Thermodesulfovibrionales bacterium]